jgi:hypothetical protein
MCIQSDLVYVRPCYVYLPCVRMLVLLARSNADFSFLQPAILKCHYVAHTVVVDGARKTRLVYILVPFSLSCSAGGVLKYC